MHFPTFEFNRCRTRLNREAEKKKTTVSTTFQSQQIGANLGGYMIHWDRSLGTVQDRYIGAFLNIYSCVCSRSDPPYVHRAWGSPAHLFVGATWGWGWVDPKMWMGCASLPNLDPPNHHNLLINSPRVYSGFILNIKKSVDPMVQSI